MQLLFSYPFFSENATQTLTSPIAIFLLVENFVIAELIVPLTMKVIVAGLNKTGTTTMHVALKQLTGYNVVHHYMETFIHAGKDWVKICEDGATVEDFRRIYEGVDAVTDNPPAYFWEELLEAFPEAKVLL